MANNDFHDGIDVCVGNWGYYSEGELRDTWMHLPMDPDEIEPWLRGHGLVDEEHEETYISDYDGLPFRCPQVFNEYARLDKLNVLAMQLTLLPEGDLAHIQAAIDHGEPLSRLDELMNLVAQADELPVYDYVYDDMYVEDQWHKTCLERSTPQENYAYTALDGDSEFWALMNRGDGELLSCFDFNSYGDIAVRNGYVELCETCYVNKRGDWPLLDEYPFEEIADETLAEWRGARGAVRDRLCRQRHRGAQRRRRGGRHRARREAVGRAAAMMFRDINQSSTMARSAYPDGNGELADFNLFATKYDAGKPSIATDGLPSELSYRVRTAIRRAVDELGIDVPEAAVVLKYPIHFYYSDASAELTGVLALPGAVAILALDGFIPKEQLAAPVVGDISRLREVADELRRRGGLEPLPVRETIYTHTVPEGTFLANQRPAAHRATGRKKGTAMDQEKYDNEVSIKFPAKWCHVTDAQGEDIVITNSTKTETWPAVLCTIPTGTDMNGIDISGYKFKTFRKPWTESDIANGKGTTVTVKKDMPVHLFKYDENDQLKTLDADPFELSKAVKAAREAYKAKMNAEAPNPQSQAAAAVAAAHGTAEQGTEATQAAKL